MSRSIWGICVVSSISLLLAMLWIGDSFFSRTEADVASLEAVSTVKFSEKSYRIPDWAGKRTDEPFDVRAFLEPRVLRGDNLEERYRDALFLHRFDWGIFWPELDDETLALKLQSIDKRAEECANTEWLPLHADSEEVKQLLAEAEPYVELIDQVLQQADKPVVLGMLDYEMMVSPNESRTFARLASIGIAYHCSQADFVASEKIAQRAFVLSNEVGRRQFYVNYLVANAIDYVVLESLVRFHLSHPDLTVEDCDRILLILQAPELNVIDRLTEAIKMDYVTVADAVAGLQSRELSLYDYGGGVIAFQLTSDSAPPQSEEYVTLDGSHLNYSLEWKALNRFYSELFSVLDQYPLTYSQWQNHLDELLQEFSRPQKLKILEKYLVFMRLKKLPYAVYAPSSVTNPSHLETVHRKQATIDATRMLAAVVRYKLEHGELPETLEQAATEAGFETVLPDAFDGKPLRYVVRDGKAVIYSVGADMQDDGGAIDWDHSTEKGDILFPVP